MTSCKHMLKTLDRLEQQAEEWLKSRLEEENRAAEEERRWEATVQRFEALLPEDLHGRVDAALEDERGPLWYWIEDLYRGRSRLPECLTQEVMRRLVLIRLDEAEKCESWEAVCLHCGLQYPMHKHPPLSEWRPAPGTSSGEQPRYVLPRFFDHDGCPACGASSKAGEMNWAHLIEDGYWFDPSRIPLRD